MRVARSRWGGRVAGWMFAYMSFALPVNRLVETGSVLAFEHTSPAYRVHILIVPKKQIEGLAQLGKGDDVLLAEVFLVIQQVVEKLGLKQYRVIGIYSRECEQSVKFGKITAV